VIKPDAAKGNFVAADAKGIACSFLIPIVLAIAFHFFSGPHGTFSGQIKKSSA